MATKIPSTNQHEILHLHYPSDCCLCKAEQKILELEKKNKELTEELDKLKNNPDCFNCKSRY